MAFFKRRIKDEELLRIKHDVEKALSEAQKALDAARANINVYPETSGSMVVDGGHSSGADARQRNYGSKRAYLELHNTFVRISAQLQAYCKKIQEDIDTQWPLNVKRKR